jgi:hypothetical protein
VGTLRRVTVSSGLFEDHDTNFHIRPDSAYEHLLVNSAGHRNTSGNVLGEVQPGIFYRPTYQAWAHDLLGALKVTASGVFVQDNNHEHWTELHPIDLIAGRTTESMLPGSDWLTKLAAERDLQITDATPPRDDDTLFAYRFLAASDTRQGSFGGVLFEGPPLWDVTRSAFVLLHLPTKPEPDWLPFVDHRIGMIQNADVSVTAGRLGTLPRLRIDVTCKARGDGGPGVGLGEAVAYWKDPAVPEIALEPTALNFGTIHPGATSTKTFRIRNVGVGPLIISVARPSPGSGFFWQALNGVTVPPGGVRTESVTFRATNGFRSDRWTAQTNNAVGPHQVGLSGTGQA